MHLVADAMRRKEALPDVGLQLLDAEAQTSILRLDAEHDSLHLLTLLHDFRRMLDALGPTQVRRRQHACGYADRAFDVVAGHQRLMDAVGHGQFVDHSQVETAKPGPFRAQFFAALRGDASGRYPARNENDREA